jgi:hypothetical protein
MPNGWIQTYRLIALLADSGHIAANCFDPGRTVTAAGFLKGEEGTADIPI